MKWLLSICLACFSMIALAQAPISTGFFSNKALDGYDTVAYFTEGQAIKGNPQWSTNYKGAEWHFSKVEHLQMFLKAPEKYAPQYGGYCAWGVSTKNDFAPSDATQWAIVDGKLYLNYNEKVKSRWDQMPLQHIEQADRNWPALIAQ